MKKIVSLMIGLGLIVGTSAVFAQAPAQQDQPKAEKTKKKKAGKKSSKKKAEQPKAQ